MKLPFTFRCYRRCVSQLIALDTLFQNHPNPPNRESPLWPQGAVGAAVLAVLQQLSVLVRAR